MKKVILFALTISIALGGILYAHAAVTDSQEKLTVYPITQVGDETVLDGLTVYMTYRCGDHLRWETAYPFGGEAETEFSYTRSTVQPVSPPESRFEIYLSQGFSSSISGGSFATTGKPYQTLIEAAAEQTPDGSSKTLELELSDYEAYYRPDYELFYQDSQRYCAEQYSITGDLLGEYFHMDPGIYYQLMQLFRFPVQPGETVSIRIDRDDQGVVNGLELYLQSDIELRMVGDLTEEGLWFIPVFQASDGTPLSYEAPQGHGLYFVPWRTNGTSYGTSRGSRAGVAPDLELLELKLPLPQTHTIEHMELDARSGSLWMLTSDQNEYRLCHYDLTTGSMTAGIPLFPAAEPDRYAHFIRDGDYLLAYAEDQLALVDADAQTLLLTAPEGAGRDFIVSQYIPGRGSLRFDGGVLVLTDAMFYRDGAFWTGVWKQGAQIYYGEYSSSLIRGNDYAYYSYITLEDDPITLK